MIRSSYRISFTNMLIVSFRSQETTRLPHIWTRLTRRRLYNQCSKCHLHKLYQHQPCTKIIQYHYLPHTQPAAHFGTDSKHKSKFLQFEIIMIIYSLLSYDTTIRIFANYLSLIGTSAN